MSKVLTFGIPVVLTSENLGDQDERDVIDTIPQVLQNEGLPIINVGAATLEERARSKTQGQGSQDWTQLTIYAVGENVEVQNHIDGLDSRDTGTSLAAPAVAGMIAIHMNYEIWYQCEYGIDRVKGNQEVDPNDRVKFGTSQELEFEQS